MESLADYFEGDFEEFLVLSEDLTQRLRDLKQAFIEYTEIRAVAARKRRRIQKLVDAIGRKIRYSAERFSILSEVVEEGLNVH